ncbi:carboxymuconolactone decarboxylase family protein [Microbacterium sp. NPDC089698]|jgi:AhpD family alkylhydroperoxidase|uniref:carboxymuconolactone decarboxylase family protein n=1 Tax=unclassified Microbacterium TaxID=2609290 RepID=UPI00283153E1|nr:carboxymuconolactone decarboxylase family protein [Microbacterium sp.]MDR2320591.1 carboxymuconolactone decarboxylase family protein [Microbacterium sp.]
MTRIDMARTNKLGYAAVLGMEAYSRKSVEARLYELIKLRASILNGCGFCVDMHATEGAKRGIPQRTLHAVGAWQHAKGFFDERELAALALTDAITQLGPETVTDEIWDAAAQHFDAGELGAIVMAICTINVWNRIAIATEMAPPIDDKHPIV